MCSVVFLFKLIKNDRNFVKFIKIDKICDQNKYSSLCPGCVSKVQVVLFQTSITPELILEIRNVVS